MRLRRAGPEDTAGVARLHRHVLTTCLPYLPELHTPEEDLAFFRDRVFVNDSVWLAEDGDSLIGYAAASSGWLNHLYVDPAAHARGVGSALFEAALSVSGPVTRLWAFQRNTQARRFYERRGFTVERLTDGSDNEEREPDVLYVKGQC